MKKSNLNIQNYYTSFITNSIGFVDELCKHFNTTFSLKLLVWLLIYPLYCNGPFFHIAEYTVIRSFLSVSLIFLN
jgi:hypothetical protein